MSDIKVLIVEDESIQAMLLQEMNEKNGYEIVDIV